MFRTATSPVPRAKQAFGKAAPMMIPYKGLNTRSPFSTMGSEYAIALDNVLVETYGLRTRKGYRDWATNIPGGTIPVHTVMHYYPASAVPVPSLLQHMPQPLADFMVVSPKANFGAPDGKLFAAKGNKIYDVTVGGAGPWVALTGTALVTTDFWTTVNVQTIAGAFLLAVNDQGGYSYYNGVNWATPTQGTGIGQIDGCNPALFAHIITYKRRVWFVEKNSTRAWYLPVDQITGKVTMFDFGSQLDHGGQLVALENWTIDSGEGMDDQLVAVASQGDVAIYSGVDPDSVSTFEIVGTYYVGPLPAGRRCVTSDGGDIYILSQFGVAQVSKLLTPTSLSAAMQQHLTYLIDPLVARLMQSYATLPGWAMFDCAKEELFVIQLPKNVEGGGEYLAQKTTTQAWSTLKYLDYTHLLNVGAAIFGGTSDGDVVRAFDGALDNVRFDGTGGTTIQCRSTPAYTTFESPALQKRFLMIRPCFLATATPLIQVTMLTDYSLPADVNTPSLPGSIGAQWNIDKWDVGLWAGVRPVIREWLGTAARGFAVAPQIDFLCGGDTLLTSVDIWYEEGGIL